MDLGDTTARKTVQGIRLLGTGSATVYVKIGVKETLNAAYVYTAEQSYIMNTTQFGAFLVSGRWVAVSVRVPQGSTQTFITGFDLQVAAGGSGDFYPQTGDSGPGDGQYPTVDAGPQSA